jgi:hypothetical protein
MVDGGERERLLEGRRLQTMGGGVGGRRVRPRWAGRKYLLCESFGSRTRSYEATKQNYVLMDLEPPSVSLVLVSVKFCNWDFALLPMC